jgi:hypothetical protein
MSKVKEDRLEGEARGRDEHDNAREEAQHDVRYNLSRYTYRATSRKIYDVTGKLYSLKTKQPSIILP